MTLKSALKILLVFLCVTPIASIASSPTHPETPPAPPAKSTSSNLGSFVHDLRPSVLPVGESMPHWSLRKRMAHYHVPGVTVAVLRHGKVVFAAGYGVRAAGSNEAVNADTLFSVGSVSKVITAAATLRLVAQGKLDLDRNVDDYLTSWHIPPNPKFPDAVVTLRMLMSHTSGLNVHGFKDFPPGKPHPTLLQTLNGTGPAANDPVHLIYKPGARFHYSGGGVEVEQLVMQNVTGSPLEATATTQVFRPLGMHRSTFAEPLPAETTNVAKAHNGKGKLVALPRGWQTFAGTAASGLWTSANDLGKFVGALIRSYQGSGDFLPKPLALDMMTEVSPSPFGLGVGLAGAGANRFFYKGGANNDYKAWIEGHLANGDGLVILTNGANGRKLYFEIRNAVADMLGWRVHRPIRTIRLDSVEQQQLKNFAGTYHVDNKLPMDLQQRLSDTNLDAVNISVKNGAISIGSHSHTIAQLLPLTPTRFLAAHIQPPVGSLQVIFHKDAKGRVRALTLLMGSARAYYTRQSPEQ